MEYANRLRQAHRELERALEQRLGPNSEDWIIEEMSPLTRTEPYVCALRHQAFPDRYATIEAGGGSTRGYAYQVMIQTREGSDEWITVIGPCKFSYASGAVFHAMRYVIE